MIASIKLLNKNNKKGHNIIVELFFSDKLRPRKTIGYSLPQFWNFEASEPYKQHPDYYLLLPTIKEYQSKIAKVNFSDLSYDDAYDTLFGKSSKALASSNLLAFFDVIIDELKLKRQSYRAFSEVKQIISKYLNDRDIAINDITYEWLNDFVMHKLSEGCGQGGAMSYLRTLRRVYKESQKRKSLNIKQDNPFLGIIKTTTTKPVVEISTKQLNEFINFTPHSSTTISAQQAMQQCCQLFMLQFYLGGVDYVDISLLKWSNIKDGRIVFTRYKNRNKPNGNVVVNNMISKKAMRIIEQYGTKDQERIFSFIPDITTDEASYIIHRNNINRSLKSICKAAGIPTVTTKTPRYIFRTYAGEKLIHDLIVMKLQGHKPEGVTYKYQGAISKEVQDQAHKSVIKL